MSYLTEEEFVDRLKRALSPSRAISDAAHLKGRGAALKESSQALSAEGRQLFVHGFRGVGKSSVALTAAKAISSWANPSLVFCSRSSKFYEIISDLSGEALGLDPTVKDRTTEWHGKASGKLFGIGAEGEHVRKTAHALARPASLNEAAALVRKAAPLIDGKGRTFIIDEFDLLEDRESHELFGEFAKLVADMRLPVKLIFCGVAENLDQLFKAHGSTFRYFHPLKLEALKPGPCLSILSDAEQTVGVEIEHNSKMRIVQICDGFPYFVHLIAEKLFWRWFNDDQRGPKTTPAQYEAALVDACSAAEPELRLPYDSVAKKYKLDGEVILWAMAEGNQLSKNLDMIERDFKALIDLVPANRRPDVVLTRNQLNSRLAVMKKPEYESIMSSNGRGWYEFTEKRMRGYARLRAASQQVELKADHPLV